MACKLCGGQLSLLGKLGNLLHYRCRQCGAMWSRKSKAKGDAR
jgi:hypothetical protein